MIRHHNQLVGLHFYNHDGWHEVLAEVAMGAFLVATTSRKGEHVTKRIWRTKEIAPYHLFSTHEEMHAEELAVRS